MKQINITNNNEGRLDSFLIKSYPKLNINNLNKFLRQNKLKVNGKKELLSYKLKSNDIINLYLDDEYFILPNKDNAFLFSKNILDIVFEDDNLLVVNKPAGIAVIDDDYKNFDTLINRIALYYHNKDNIEKVYFQLCHRLDTGTQGLVLVAKNSKCLEFMLELFKNKELEKRYLCLSKGNLKNKTGIQKAYLTKNSKAGYVTISDKETTSSKEIYTDIKVISTKNSINLLEIKLITGRTHQIRAHLSWLDNPILGDSRYGDNAINRKYKLKYQCLCSYKLTFPTILNNDFSYLSKKAFTAPKPWFAKSFYEGEFDK